MALITNIKRGNVESNDQMASPPELTFTLPTREDIGKKFCDWSSDEIQSRLPTDILLLTVKDHEFNSCHSYMRQVRQSLYNDLGQVVFGEFGDGGVRVVLIRGGRGPVAVSTTAKKAVELFNAKVLVLVGCCASVNPVKAKLGDVVISAKLGMCSRKITRVNVSRGMSSLILCTGDRWVPPLRDQSKITVQVHRDALILTGPEMVANLEKRKETLRSFPDALGVEMEGEGLYEVACDFGIEWVVVKGVSDFADGDKTAAEWQLFSSVMAASVVHNMFKHPDVIQHWPRYKKSIQGVMSAQKVPWKWESISEFHRQRLKEFVEYGQENPKEVEEINGVRICCSRRFLIGIGRDGIRVYVGLGNYGCERAVKRLPKDICASITIAEHKKKILRKPNAAGSSHVVSYWFLNEESDKRYSYLIMDLCEETLERFVVDRSSDELKADAPDVIQQILKGLDYLHSEPNAILHGDLKPSNILRNVHGKWLLADFGISRALTPDAKTHRTSQVGAEYWRAVESYLSDCQSDKDPVRCKKESDIQVAGMLLFYVATKGEHVFGGADRLRNLLDGKPVGLDKLKDPVLKGLSTWMLSHDPEDRPSAKEALKHPYLQPRDQQFLIKGYNSALYTEAYSRALEIGEARNTRIPIIIIGQDRAGKTSLKKHIFGQPFEPQEPSTNGIDVNMVQLTDENAEDPWGGMETKFFASPDEAQEEILKNAARMVTEEKRGVESMQTVSRVQNQPELLKPEVIAKIDEMNSESANTEKSTTVFVHDFAGQSIFYDTHFCFLKMQCPYLLVVDVHSSLDEPAKPCFKSEGWKRDRHDPFLCTNFDYVLSWLKVLEKLSYIYSNYPSDNRPEVQLPPVVIALTNSDQRDADHIHHFKERIRCILKENAYPNVFAQIHVIDNTSPERNGSEIRKLRRKLYTLCKSILDRQPPMPVRWLQLEVELGRKVMDDGLNHVSLEDCRAAAESCKVVDFDHAITFLHDRGIVVHHNESPVVILDPPWLMNLFTEIISIPEIDEKNPKDAPSCKLLGEKGILMQEDLRKKVDGNNFLECLMKQFSLICPWEYEGKEAYIIPSVAPVMKEGKSVQEVLSKSPIVPVFVKFNWGYVPLGFYIRFQTTMFNMCREDLVAEPPQLFCNYTRLTFERREGRFNVHLIKIPAKIEVGVVPEGRSSKQTNCDFALHLKQVLMNCTQKVITEERLIYKNLTAALEVKCPASCHEFWLLEELQTREPICRHDPVKVERFSVDRIRPWLDAVRVDKTDLNYEMLKMEYAKIKEEMKETMLELGRTSVELTRHQNEKKRSELFIKTYKSHEISTQTTELSPTAAGAGVSTDQVPSTSIEASRTEAGNINEVEGREAAPFEMSIQESLNETSSLTNMPTTGVDGSMYNNYKYLLLRIAHGLLEDDVAKLNQWAQHEFGIDASGNVYEIFMELDRKKVISVRDLSRLKAFFEDIFRFDFVCLIESYLMGNYGKLKKPVPIRRLGSSIRGLRRTQNGLTDDQSRPSRELSRSSSTDVRRSTTIPQDPAVALHDAVTTLQRNFQRSLSAETQAGNLEGLSSTVRHSTKRPATRIGPESQGASSQKPFPHAVQRTSFPFGRGKETARNVSGSSSQGVVAVDGGRSGESEAPQRTAQASANSSTVRADQTNTSRNTDSGSNGQKLSKFQQPDASGGNSTQGRGNRTNGVNLDDQWLCSHYKRRCYIQFECCEKFWPCHRCHNNHSSCGRKKLKSRDTKRIKCVACNQEQQFAQYCSRCNAKFAKYFCALCKHLTGIDDSPYHCQKCGICRIHGDRSFHCDICGVCLDVQLRGNHKCREGSAHDECCICLEDAFTGCQILPCSHKVHKDCATQMIRSGITRCPICRESFAHKLERRPHPSKKPPGK